ncbi:hypothetical protein BWQ96_10633 [Gracilariopsis chorda]|uniref:Uncharacterized protein n=1 Tax=Gracilariopsis chorda TaxID=448386 RepID=A0A2V3IBH5_9FLOR|nr:hypothetical protein BWQ96_10852 [Gracilariopsis chorda]PXF39666.1 hypothetical protein BWQ96_10633 [Gracilariopsis chorda]|eukprot:PXF39459.1 hypothetical protein BWQ96_10852 [Gracilariopsis chorda]
MNAHQQIVDALPYREQPLVLQTASSAYLRVASLPEARNCRPLTVPYSKIERVQSASTLHNVLIYIAAVLGATKKTLIEIDSARDYGQRYTASAFTPQGWSAVVLQERWSAYEACRTYYEPIQKSLARTEGNIEVVDAGTISDMQQLNSLLSTAEGVGVVDVMTMFAGGGRDVSLFSKMLSCVARPRVIALFYQAYWGTLDRSRVGAGVEDEHGRERYFTGASLSALVRIGTTVRYRLVWCVPSMAVAIFVDENEGQGLRTISARSCIGRSKEWKRDAEAMWDEAQAYEWT